MRQSWLCACAALSFYCIDGVAAEAEENKEEKKVVVTGSLIKKTDQKGPAPIFSISSDELARLGHTNLYDALTALTAQTGSLLEGDQFPNGFTSAAQAINLRGFGPGRTLVLINGQRLALNPTPYQSESNFFNFATIPTVAIERVDVLTDGASAIYGSDAIAGVINIILREEFDSNELAMTYGVTYEGGGQSFKLSGGNSFRSDGQLLTFGYQWEKREPIYGFERDSIESFWRSTSGQDIFSSPAIAEIAIIDGEAFSVFPGGNACRSHPELQLSPNYYCERNDLGDRSLRNDRERVSLYSRGEWELSSGKLSVNLLKWKSSNHSRNFRLNWSESFFSVNDSFELVPQAYIRTFSPLETGNQDQKFNEDSTSLIAAFEGMTSNFDYQFQIVSSQYRHKQSALQIRDSETMAFFIDPIGYIDDFGNFISVNDYTGIGVPIQGTPEGDVFTFFNRNDLSDLIGNSRSSANSRSSTVSYWMSGDGFELNDAFSRYALVLEWNQTSYDINVDPTSQNFGWYNLGGSSGSGDRDRLAIGLEWLLPLVSSDSFGDLDLTLAGRWDDYQDDSGVESAKTGKVALQWKINEEFSIRAVKSTSFRAPDMHYLFADNTRYFTSVIDIHECISSGRNYDNCQNNSDYLESIQVDWQGTSALEEETGNTQSLGLVYQPSQQLSFTLDYYDIELRNQVGLQLESQHLLWEAQCRAGENFVSGQPVDINDAFCQQALSNVERFASDSNFIRVLNNQPVNRAFRRQKGVDLLVNGFTTTDSAGTFGFDLQYSHIFETQVQELSSEPTTFDPDFRDSPENGEIRTRSNLTLSWGLEDWTTALSMYRKGSQPNADGSKRLDAWELLNLSISRNIDDDKLLFIIRNLTNKKPVFDPAQNSWPFFDRSQYDAVGREVFLEYRMRY